MECSDGGDNLVNDVASIHHPNFTLSRNQHFSHPIIKPDMQNRRIELHVTSPDVIRHSKNLHCSVLGRNNDLVIQLIPYNLQRLSLHLYCTYLNQPQQIYYLDASISPSPVSACHQLSTMTVYDLRALFYKKFSIHLKFCEKNPVYSNAIFKGKQERVTVRVDGR